MSIRRLLTIVTAALGAVAFLTALAMAGTSALIHRASAQQARALESVRAAEEIEVNLLLHGNSPAAIHPEILKWLDRASREVTSPEESRLLEDLRGKVERYLAASDGGRAAQTELRSAVESAERLVGLSLANGAAAAREGAEWSRIADVASGIVVVLLLLVIVAVLTSLRSLLYGPMAGLRGAMLRFGRGDLDARAPPHGPVEIREIGATFNAMVESLTRQRETQFVFLAAVAHDLRNPLSSLKLAATSVTARRAPVDEPTRRALEMVVRQVDHLDRMVEDLLDSSRIEAGNLDLKLEDHDLRSLVHEAAELFGGTSLGHRIEVRLPAEPLFVHCDVTRIAQVFNNLLSNAIKYSPGGGEVSLAASIEDGRVIVSITDHGIGISPEDQVHLFEPFRRVGPSHRHISGVGLGLSVARRIVHAHGGAIEVESATGQGSTFRIRLPLRRVSGDAGPEVEARPLH